MQAAAVTDNLSLPRILCLHGGGVNAEVFRLQARAIISALKHQFRFVFADGPFFCDAGPGIVPVYEDFGPFRRWLRWLPEQKKTDADTAKDEVWWQLEEAMNADNKEGATGEFVGLLGFSQGAKLSASLLFEQQYRNKRKGEDGKDKAKMKAKIQANFRFAVLLAGRAPLVSLRSETDRIPGLVTSNEISEGEEELKLDTTEHILRLPTIHVHGRRDAGLHLHQRLLRQYCDPGSTILLEWDGEHRVPYKATDVKPIADAIIEVMHRS